MKDMRVTEKTKVRDTVRRQRMSKTRTEQKRRRACISTYSESQRRVSVLRELITFSRCLPNECTDRRTGMGRQAWSIAYFGGASDDVSDGGAFGFSPLITAVFRS